MSDEKSDFQDGREPFSEMSHFLLPLFTAFALGSVAFFFFSSRPALYKAVGSFYVIDSSPKFAAIRSAIGDSQGSLSGYVYSLATSSSLKLKTAQKLNLWNNLHFWTREPKEGEAAMAKEFDRHLEVGFEGGMVTLAATTLSPELSVEIVSVLMSEIQSTLRSNAKARSISLDSRLKEIEDRLEAAEFKLELFREETEFVADEQVANKLSVMSELGRQLTLWEAQYSGTLVRKDSPGGIDDMLELDSEARGRYGALTKLRERVEVLKDEMKSAPEQLRRYEQLRRRVLSLSKLEVIAAQNLEAARMDELEELAPLRTIDTPVLPGEPERRHVLRYTLGAALIGFALGAAVIWMKYSSGSRDLLEEK